MPKEPLRNRCDFEEVLFSSGYFEDGQRVAVGEAFHVGGASIRYPGDPQASGYLIYNCRCTLVSAVKGIDQSDAPRASKLDGMSYEDWKAGKEQESVEKFGNSGIIATRNAIKSGEVSTRINPQKQNRHIKIAAAIYPEEVIFTEIWKMRKSLSIN